MEWRRNVGIKDKNPEELLGCSREILDQHCYSTHLGNDAQDNDSPVIYRRLVVVVVVGGGGKTEVGHQGGTPFGCCYWWWW